MRSGRPRCRCREDKPASDRASRTRRERSTRAQGGRRRPRPGRQP
jgi:hypothetical protein